MFTLLGDLHCQTTINGWIPHKLVLAVNNAGTYQMKFNIQTFDKDGKMVVCPCVCEGTVAKEIYETYRKQDMISVWGQPKHTYVGSVKQVITYTKILSYSMITQFPVGLTLPELNEEDTNAMQYIEAVAHKYLAEKKAKPSDEEVKSWVDYWEKKYGNK